LSANQIKFDIEERDQNEEDDEPLLLVDKDNINALPNLPDELLVDSRDLA
jgi:hypothetical protein